jgi:hypothetical protein
MTLLIVMTISVWCHRRKSQNICFVAPPPDAINGEGKNAQIGVIGFRLPCCWPGWIFLPIAFVFALSPLLLFSLFYFVPALDNNKRDHWIYPTLYSSRILAFSSFPPESVRIIRFDSPFLPFFRSSYCICFFSFFLPLALFNLFAPSQLRSAFSSSSGYQRVNWKRNKGRQLQKGK